MTAAKKTHYGFFALARSAGLASAVKPLWSGSDLRSAGRLDQAPVGGREPSAANLLLDPPIEGRPRAALGGTVAPMTTPLRRQWVAAPRSSALRFCTAGSRGHIGPRRGIVRGWRTALSRMLPHVHPTPPLHRVPATTRRSAEPSLAPQFLDHRQSSASESSLLLAVHAGLSTVVSRAATPYRALASSYLVRRGSPLS